MKKQCNLRELKTNQVFCWKLKYFTSQDLASGSKLIHHSGGIIDFIKKIDRFTIVEVSYGLAYYLIQPQCLIKMLFELFSKELSSLFSIQCLFLFLGSQLICLFFLHIFLCLYLYPCLHLLLCLHLYLCSISLYISI